MNNPNEIYIIGGGRSILEGIPILKDKLQGKLTIALNKSIEVFPDSTFLSFVDCLTFYNQYIADLAKYPLIIGRKFNDKNTTILPNTVVLKESSKYDRTLKNGVYSGYLAGLFALSLAVYLIDEGNIYCLGFDGGALPNQDLEDVTDKLNKLDEQSKQRCLKQINGRYYRIYSHFYQGEIEHRGIGKVEFYTMNDKINKLFQPFQEEHKCKIYNVSLLSNLNTFSKINYTTMFSQINNTTYSQQDLREWVKKRIGEI